MCRYKQGAKLAGVLYFHRISDVRMGGISTRNFGLFRKLCGDKVLKNVIIVTNRWEEVDVKVGEKREAELAGDDLFFKPVLEKGARMARHRGTAASAKKIIRLILENQPMPLRIQEELVIDRDLRIIDRGGSLEEELQKVIARREKEMQELIGEMRQAMEDKDQEMKRELEVERQKMQAQIEKFQNPDSQKERETERLGARLQHVELEAKKELERAAAQRQKQNDELMALLKDSLTASQNENARLRKEIDELNQQLRKA